MEKWWGGKIKTETSEAVNVIKMSIISVLIGKIIFSISCESFNGQFGNFVKKFCIQEYFFEAEQNIPKGFNVSIWQNKNKSNCENKNRQNVQ